MRGEVVRDENPTGFTVESNVVMFAIFILGCNTREGEVDRETLEGLLGSHDGMRARWFFTLF